MECEHEWFKETMRESNFGVALGVARLCVKCGVVQYDSWCTSERGGTGWITTDYSGTVDYIKGAYKRHIEKDGQ